MTDILLDEREAEELATKACRAAGADEATTCSLVNATLSAERNGRSAVGFAHLVDYLKSFSEGRINCTPRPRLSRPFPAFLTSDADEGIAQLGFDRAFEDIVEVAKAFGVAVFTQRNSYSTGELGFYVRRIAERGLISLAASNANAVLAASIGGSRVYGTNPIAMGYPLGSNAAPVVVDQASSETALVNVIAAIDARQAIPSGWAIDAGGRPTTDPSQALRGALLPFGGRKGANIALIIEMLSAGLSGGAWSLDASDFLSGERSPSAGLTLIAIRPDSMGDGAIARAASQVNRLSERGVYVPGVTRAQAAPGNSPHIAIPASVYSTIMRIVNDRAANLGEV
ncbi:Ldh family oxidoreductase [Rhizobium leguminosarum]|uniref:Ldh family oxidoreductase n=1 Tax=Rhizobium leguminosarum TaxID=384 RepID=UPI003F9958D3